MYNELTRRGVLRTGAALATGAAFSGTATASHGGDTIVVDDDGGGDFQTIQEALDHAGDGDTIAVREGEYDEAIRVSTPNLTVEAVEEDVAIDPQTAEQMDPRNRIVDIEEPGVTFRGFTVVGVGRSSDDIGIYTGNRGADAAIEDNEVREAEFGITAGTGGDGSSIVGNVVTETEGGITVLSPSVTVEANEIVDVNRGFHTYDNYGDSRDAVLRGNSFSEVSQAIRIGDRATGIAISGNEIDARNWGIVSLPANTQRGSVEDNEITAGRAGIYSAEADLEIRGNLLRECIAGVGGVFGDVTVEENDFEDNEEGVGVGDPHGVTVNRNNFEGNAVGVKNYEVVAGTLDATENWWGHASGPGGEDGRTNPAGREVGRGDDIDGDVDFDPWLRRPVDA